MSHFGSMDWLGELERRVAAVGPRADCGRRDHAAEIAPEIDRLLSAMRRKESAVFWLARERLERGVPLTPDQSKLIMKAVEGSTHVSKRIAARTVAGAIARWDRALRALGANPEILA